MQLVVKSGGGFNRNELTKQSLPKYIVKIDSIDESPVRFVRAIGTFE